MKPHAVLVVRCSGTGYTTELGKLSTRVDDESESGFALDVPECNIPVFAVPGFEPGTAYDYFGHPILDESVGLIPGDGRFACNEGAIVHVICESKNPIAYGDEGNDLAERLGVDNDLSTRGTFTREAVFHSAGGFDAIVLRIDGSTFEIDPLEELEKMASPA